MKHCKFMHASEKENEWLLNCLTNIIKTHSLLYLSKLTGCISTILGLLIISLRTLLNLLPNSTQVIFYFCS